MIKWFLEKLLNGEIKGGLVIKILFVVVVDLVEEVCCIFFDYKGKWYLVIYIYCIKWFLVLYCL